MVWLHGTRMLRSWPDRVKCHFMGATNKPISLLQDASIMQDTRLQAYKGLRDDMMHDETLESLRYDLLHKLFLTAWWTTRGRRICPCLCVCLRVCLCLVSVCVSVSACVHLPICGHKRTNAYGLPTRVRSRFIVIPCSPTTS